MGKRGGGEVYEPSVQVKTVLKPHERTWASDSERESISVEWWTLARLVESKGDKISKILGYRVAIYLAVVILE